jgi:serine/threonine protein kinase
MGTTELDSFTKVRSCKRCKAAMESLPCIGKTQYYCRCGQDHDYNFLVMERVGTNLEQLFKKCGEKFSLKTVLMIGIETLNILHFYHYKGLTHRCICPSNFAIGFGKKNTKMYVLDFSSTVRFKNMKTQTHINEIRRGFCSKNIHFSSANANSGIDGSRRDDMQSWMYMLLYFLKGTLSWKGL